ncbi:MAG: DUF5813 family protein [Halanaeroarchaeum sp.]
MSDGIERALSAHDRFEGRATGFVPTGITFDATVRVEDGTVTIEQTLPTLDAAVVGETVAPVVEDGWFETLDRRVRDVGGVTKADDVRVTRVSRGEGSVTVRTALEASPGTIGDDALAVVSYVEGTWVEGIIPGYDYVDTVEDLRETARRNAQG